MNRKEMIARVRERSHPWDIIVIGGGATGAGVAVDAATRGFDVLLVEREDFGKGTSSRSTKLIHGGVRYLEQGNVSLVMEALRERGRLFHNAPHLVHDLPFVVPTYSWWESPFYGIGLKVYDLLAGKFGFGKSRLLSRDETLEKLPALQLEGLRGGVIYHDGQFDDTRLLMHLLATAVDHGATVLNYAAAVQLSKGPDNFVNGVVVEDRESGENFQLPARVVVNATGIFTDEIRRLDEPNCAVAPPSWFPIPATAGSCSLFRGMGTPLLAPQIRQSTSHRTSPLLSKKRSSSFWRQRHAILAVHPREKTF
jgi:glycerol-3-phosphate dehydrogenase